MPDDFNELNAHIHRLSGVARTSWLGCLTFLAFVGVTLLGVEDADFFILSRQTELPLVGVAIPTFSFFVLAPPLSTALYVHLHIQLVKLWTPIAEAREAYGTERTARASLPWLVIDLALHPENRHPLAWLANVSTWLLVWAAGPVVLASAWVRSMPAHNEALTLWIGSNLLLSLLVGWRSFAAFRAVMQGRRRLAVLGQVLGTLAITVAVGAWSWLTTEGDPLTEAFLVPADLSGIEFIPRPSDWHTPDVSRPDFAGQFCGARGYDPLACGQVTRGNELESRMVASARRELCDAEGLNSRRCAVQFGRLEAQFEDAFWADRAANRTLLPRIDLAGSDLRGADLSDAFLPGASLIGARLDGASFDNAVLEGADLSAASISNASFRSAQMQGANLSGSHADDLAVFSTLAERTLFRDARLERAIVFRRRLVDVNFAGADLSEAFFVSVDFERVEMTVSDLPGALFHRVDGDITFGTATLQGAIFSEARLSVVPPIGYRGFFVDEFRDAVVLENSELQAVDGREAFAPDGPRRCFDNASRWLHLQPPRLAVAEAALLRGWIESPETDSRQPRLLELRGELACERSYLEIDF